MHPGYLISRLVFAYIRIISLPYYLFSRLFGLSYQIVHPAATYAPWLKDKVFLEHFWKLKKHSLVNIYQAWELWTTVANQAGTEGDILEVGVWRGSTSILMGLKLQGLGSGKKVYACDTFEGVVKAGSEEDNCYSGGEHKDTSLAFVDRLVHRNGLSNITLLKGIFPEDTGHIIADKKFSICHIDVDAYESGRGVLEWVWPRLVTGGIVLFNDYGFPATKGITKLVNEYRGKDGCIMFHNLNGNGLLIKTK